MTEDQRRAIPYVVRAALASVGMACFLLLLKGFAAWQTASVAMLGSLADTGLDLLASLVTLYGVRLAATPADMTFSSLLDAVIADDWALGCQF